MTDTELTETTFIWRVTPDTVTQAIALVKEAVQQFDSNTLTGINAFASQRGQESYLCFVVDNTSPHAIGLNAWLCDADLVNAPETLTLDHLLNGSLSGQYVWFSGDLQLLIFGLDQIRLLKGSEHGRQN